MKWLEIIALLFTKLFEFLNRREDQNIGRMKERSENERIIEDRVKHADKTRDSDIDDSFLLQPEQRGSGGVQSVQADICEHTRSAEDGSAASDASDKGAQ